MKKPKHLGKVLLVILGLLIVAQPAIAAPLIDYSANDVNWYDERGNNVCSGNATVGDTAVVNASDNEKTIFFTLLANGFSKPQAAAVLGNLQQESGFDPHAVEHGGTGEGRGIVQWGVNARWKEYQSWLGSGKDIWDLTNQLKWMFYELHHGYKKAYDDFMAAKTLSDWVNIWMNEYEQAGVPGPRLAYAQQVMQKDYYKTAQDTGTGGTTATTGTSSGGSCSTTGGASASVDGFIVYSQYDPRWKDHPYGTSSIGPSGCGPSAMAMIITNLTGKTVTPIDVADWAGAHGLYISHEGSSWNIGPAVAAHWNLSSKAVGLSETKINAALRAGAYIIISGMGSLPFTSAGHFIVIRAVTADGKWMVGDSAHTATNKQKFDPQTILSQANGGSSYAISK